MSDFVIIDNNIDTQETNQHVQVTHNIILKNIIGKIRFYEMITKVNLPIYSRNPINLCFVIDTSNYVNYHHYLDNLKGEINWKDGDDIEVQIAGTFAKDKFIVLKNASKNPFENAQPHPYFDYEKKVFTKDGREEYIKEQKELKK